MRLRLFERESWDGWSYWFCACGKHSYGVTFVRYLEEGNDTSNCDRCGTGPTRLVCVTKRVDPPSWFKVELAAGDRYLVEGTYAKVDGGGVAQSFTVEAEA